MIVSWGWPAVVVMNMAQQLKCAFALLVRGSTSLLTIASVQVYGSDSAMNQAVGIVSSLAASQGNSIHALVSR